MKLDKLRHFSFPRDEIAFEDKKSAAVWRGGAHNPVRKELVLRYRGHPLFDVGFSDVQPTQADYGPFLHPKEQMAYRYIISLEGVDVASNLKWIMASNSLCLMPPPNYETWFMEGRLQPGIHYVQVAPDMHDLEDKLLFYERHPDDARAIIRNANDYVSQFLNAGMERVVSILVMYKYFVATGQVEPDKTVESLISL
ncbi:MAG: glycosyl transferase family 90 [Pseudomonadota bacterium]